MKVLSFDVESMGLNGEAFALGISVWEDGKEIDSVCVSRSIERYIENGQYALRDCSTKDLIWLCRNLPEDILYPEHRNESLGAEFEKMREKYPNAIVLADCGYPVETNFLKVYGIDVYPLIDLGSILLAKGKDSIGNCERKENELPKHNPLCDARQAARIFFELMEEK